MLLSRHPNILDKIYLKIYPGYLYSGQLCQCLSTINVGIIHKLPDSTSVWKIMDYLYLKKGSLLKFLGLAKKLRISEDIQPLYSILESVSPQVDETKSADKHLSPGDLIIITPIDRQFITPAPLL
jgi:hypothetical protein